MIEGETKGPRQLSGPKSPELYGFSDLRGPDKETCRKGTILAVRSVALACIAQEIGIPWLIENPWQLEEDDP